jgi:hypothetical protein
VITETWFPRSVSTTKLPARQMGAQGSGEVEDEGGHRGLIGLLAGLGQVLP